LPVTVSPTDSLMLALQAPLWVLQHVPSVVFVFCYGAAVGSFINVVVYRLPLGMSVISPPSRCPTCGAKLRFFRENLPILGWFMVRGRCRYCGAPVSWRYMFFELLMALLFAGLYIVLFMFRPTVAWWGEIGGEWWYDNGFWRVVPAFVAWSFLIAGLIAMTMIDAKTFTIPIQIPVFVTVSAFIAYPLQTLLPLRPLATVATQTWPIPCVGWSGCLAAFGGVIGILIGILLLRSGRLRYSFADYEDYVEEGETLGDYPHARREMGLEILFLTPCIIGLITGWLLGTLPNAAPPQVVQALGASMIGYISGGAIMWAIRILGTLAFGREAMGLGDVHLLAAVGAVLGWVDPLLTFFLAPFSGLGWWLLSKLLAPVFKGVRHEIPFGPHLAVATLALLVCRPGIEWAWNAYFPPNVRLPQPGFVTSEPATTPRPMPAGGEGSGPAPATP
jgi:leader peptidase (prepilin peptidase)/N-methyltransferase